MLGRLLACTLFLCMSAAFADEGHDHQPIAGEKLGKVDFPVSCSAPSRAAFAVAVAKLHSFWYEVAERDFNAIAEKEPACTMAYWGVAMTNYRPLWYSPNPSAQAKARAALEKARAQPAKTPRERAYVAAIDDFFTGYDAKDHQAKAEAYSRAMEQIAKAYPKDKEATIFFALSLLGTASPRDKTLSNQRRAGALLEPLFRQYPQHPGLAHYIIHSYDNATLAQTGLNAARAYAKIAPSAPHALHMPSHIFIRLGLWDEAARSNEAAAQAGRHYEADNKMADGIAWDQRLHPQDYLEYAYLQMGQIDKARAVMEDVAKVKNSQPSNTTGSFARAAIPARYWLEQGNWSEAAKLPIVTELPETQAITHWARAVGAARSGNVAQAKDEVAALKALRDRVQQSPGPYPWQDVIEVQRLQAAAWVAHAEGRNDEAVTQMRAAAELEDKTEKHPVTPGAVLPAHEQLADLLLDLGKPAEAVKEYEATLRESPKRRRAVEALDKQKVASN